MEDMEKNNFEKLILWEKTHAFVLFIYRITKKFPKEEQYLLIDQLRRSSSSIAANIVEGNEKKSKKEYLQYLYNSKGSLAETKYHILLARDLGYLEKKEYSQLQTDADEIGKLLSGLIHYLTSSISHLPSKQSAFTFIELVVSMAIIALLTIVFLGLFNPLKQVQKSWDGKRKNDLSTMQKALEDWYDDKGAFPNANQICFDSVSSSRIDDYGKTACYCQVCGNRSGSPSFSPYLSRLPCDPQSTAKEYLYDFDCSGTKPAFYRVYTKLSITTDRAITELGCQYGCGPAQDYAYNYGISNGQDIERRAKSCGTNKLYQKDDQGFCNICNNRVDPDVCNYSNDVFIDVSCTTPCFP